MRSMVVEQSPHIAPKVPAEIWEHTGEPSRPDASLNLVSCSTGSAIC